MTDAPVLVASAYLATFVGGFVVVACWETLAPARAARAPLARRWPANFGLLAINHGLLPLLLPLPAAAAAWFAAERGWGLMNAFPAPAPVAFALTLVAMDLARYAMHRAYHGWTPLWRLHRVHHSDLDYDCTLGQRFHPFEAIVSALAMAAFVVALGAPVAAVIVSDLVTLGLAYFTHGNVRVPGAIERALRRVVVTPALHATHHSVEPDESRSNFGSVLSVWDRLFGTLRDAPRAGDAIAFGLEEERDAAKLGFGRLLALPFRARAG